MTTKGRQRWMGVSSPSKYEVVQQLIVRAGATLGASLLDVGCRQCEFRNFTPPGVSYVGVDLTQNDDGTVDHVIDVERGLPFPDRSFDFVLALDFVEHLNDFKSSLVELMRVTKRQLVVALPNLGFFGFRFRFLTTGRLGGKYDLLYGMGTDRHRWVTILPQTDQYMSQFASEIGLILERTICQESPKKELIARVGKAIGMPAAWWAWKAVYTLSRADNR